MPGKIQELKGKIEEAVGKITKNDRLKEVGQIDQTAGQLKQGVSKAKRSAIKDITKMSKVAKKATK